MFFDGDLQTGVALALEQSRVVVCFVTGANDLSRLWENEYLQDKELHAQLAANAVVLRMEGGSQEALYLAAFHPVSSVPTIVVINNGKLLADIHGNLPKETWKRNFITALNGETVQDTHPPTSSSTNNSISEAQGRITPEYQRHEMHVPANSTVQDLLDERRLRLDVDQKEKKAAERAERLAKQETQRAAADNALPGSVRAKQASYAQQQKKKQQEMQQERERILKVIESDKLERKHKEEMRKTISQAGQLGDDGIERLIDRQLANEINQSESRVSKDCAIQVRLFDGSNIRSRFSPDQNIRTNIRTWIDKKRGDSDTPYTFKQILAPQPNRAISISEEEESLQELGLTPSATLVMVPVHGYTAAYSTDAGYISNGISLCYNTVFTGVVGIAGAFGTFLGVASEVAPSQNGRATQSPTQESPRGSSSGIKFRTLRDQQKSEDSQQFYNGNQLNFEPRSDDDTKDM